MKTKFDKKIVSGLIVSVFSTQMMSAMAQSVSTQSSDTVPTLSTSGPTIPGLPNLTYYEATNAPPGCNKEIMQLLNSRYVMDRTAARNLQYTNQMNGLVMTTPKANQMDCFQQAMQNIKNLMRAIDSIIAMFSGKMNMDAIMQSIVNMALKAACQEVNQVTGSISSSLNTTTNGINGTLGQINGTQLGSGGMTTTVGGIISAGNQPQQQGIDVIGGSVSGVSNTWGTVNNTVNNAGSTTSSIADKIQSISPFQSGTPGH